VSHYVVGLTGGIGSGKSSVAKLFVDMGAVLVDTDAIAHELTGPGGEAMPALREAFGAAVADASGALDRAAMRQRVFADPAARGRLEGILHPLIRRHSEARCRAAASPYVILGVPLLIESGDFRQRCQRIVVVDCPETLQIERVMARNGLSEGEVRAIMAVQATRSQRLAAADDVVVNDADLSSLYPQVEALHQNYLRLSAEILKASC
jgi:dephospho-CoA kinase